MSVSPEAAVAIEWVILVTIYNTPGYFVPAFTTDHIPLRSRINRASYQDIDWTFAEHARLLSFRAVSHSLPRHSSLLFQNLLHLLPVFARRPFLQTIGRNFTTSLHSLTYRFAPFRTSRHFIPYLLMIESITR